MKNTNIENDESNVFTNGVENLYCNDEVNCHDEDGECFDGNEEECNERVVEMSSKYAAEDYKAFQEINRDEEDSLVCQYIKNKDTGIMLKLLNIREQTLRYMARKYAYLDNEDDMYSEFKGVWLKCLKKYNGGMKMRQARDKSGNLLLDENGSPKMVSKKTPFNTYLFTSMKNRVSNIIKKRHSKKLLDDSGNPVSETMRSLDYEYGDDGDMTLKDLIKDESSARASSAAEMYELMKHLGTHTDADVARAVDTFLNNPRFETLTAACNYRVGTLRITKFDKDFLSIGVPKNGVEPKSENLKKATDYLKAMVDSTGNFSGKYEIVSFILRQNRVDFVAHMDDPKVLRKVKEAVMKCRKVIAEAHFNM